MASEIEIVVKTVDQATGELKKITKEFQSLTDTSQRFTKITKDVEKGTSTITDTIRTSRTAFRKFRMELLSVLFGMQMITRGLMRLGTSALAEFKRATESTTFWNTAIGQLTIGFTMIRIALGEAINQALRPFADWFIKVLPDIIDFIAKHGELIAQIGLLTTALAGAAGLIAGFALLSDGISILIGKAGISGVGVAGLYALLAAIVGLGIVAFFKKLKEEIEEHPEDWKNITESLDELGDMVEEAKDSFKELINEIKLLGDEFSVLLGFESAIDLFWSGVNWWLDITLEGVKALTAGWKTMIEVMTLDIKIKGIGVEAITEIFKQIKEAISKVEFGKGTFGGKGATGSFQFGGVIPATGLYKMHAGEIVSNPSFSSSVSVSASQMSSNVDINHLANRVSSIIMRDVKKWVTPVSQYG